MALDIIFTSSLLIIFTIILWIISTFLTNQVIKAPKVARQFLISLTLYFFLMSLCNLSQAIAFLTENVPAGVNTVYNNYISLLFIYSAPIYLIFQVEGNFFKEKKIISEKHIFSLISFILFIVFLLITLIPGILDPSIFEQISMVKYSYILYPLWLMNNFIILFAFFYLGIKTTEKYRIYSFLICIGWTLNQIFNVLLQFPGVNKSNPILLIVFIMKYIGATITALFLYKLYTLRKI